MPGFVLPRLIVRGYLSTRSSGLRFQEFDAVYSENGVSSQETSSLVAQLKGREVGRIRSQLDAPDVDKRFLGAATARAEKLLHYHTFLALIGDDIDKSEEALAEPSSTKLDSAPSSSTYCALSSSTCTVATGENDEGRNTLLQSSTDWEVTLVRFREDGAAVQGCEAGSSLSNFYDICFFPFFKTDRKLRLRQLGRIFGSRTSSENQITRLQQPLRLSGQHEGYFYSHYRRSMGPCWNGNSSSAYERSSTRAQQVRRLYMKIS